MNKRAVFFIFFAITTTALFAQTPAAGATLSEERSGGELPAPSLEEQRMRIIRYGTDTEIANLIKILRNEQPSDPEEAKKITPLDRELTAVAEKTKNRAILSGTFGYFADREIGELEKRAILAVEDRDYEAGETVNAAILYLGKIQAVGARKTLMEIINGEETRYLSGAIRSLGQIAEKEGQAETAEYLVEYYTNREPGDENRRLIIVALGDLKAKEGTAFLVSIAENEDERVPLRMNALEALGKIADPAGLDAIIGAVSSKDPNVRASAVGSLAPFSGDETEAAIIEAFRDSYYRTRIAAAKAAGERKLAASIPFLRFRCENDEVPAVRDESVKALGLIGGNEAETILKELFKERKNSDRIRINSAEMLLTHGSADYVTEVIIELDEAKTKNQTALYNGFLRILGVAKSPKLEDLARRFFAGGGVIEKSYALDICSNNNFQGLVDEIRCLTDPKNGSLSRKSTTLLQKWGLPLTTESPGQAENAVTSPDSASTPALQEPVLSGAAGSSQ
ncbi:MAG: HEAT repeat domain-containing protein [Treponema sp.]|nr:HEAT repeat domain-containing protein [Treponema sp.]